MQVMFGSKCRRVAGLNAFFLGLLLASGVAAEGAMKPVSTWDLGGIKLGMTPDEVQKVFAARGFALTGPPGMMQCAAGQAQHEMTGVIPPFACVQRMDATSPKATYTVYYYEDFPRHPGVSRVYTVVYTPKSPSGNVSDADRQAFLADLTKKFGMYSAKMGLGVQWCPIGAAYPMGPCAGVSIGVSMGDLMTTLADTDLDHRSEDAINAYVQSRKHNINPGI
jgi:hypothetical protein